MRITPIIRMGWIVTALVLTVCVNESYAYTAKYIQTVENPAAKNEEDPQNTSIIYDVWLNDNNMRMDTEVNGAIRSMLIREDGIYTYMPRSNVYMKSPAMPKWPAGLRNPVDFVMWVKNHEKETLKGEMMNGYMCDVFRYRDEASGSIVTVWIWQGHDFPIKIAFAGGLIESLITFRNVELNQPIPAEIFELPKDSKEFNPNSLSAMFEEMMSVEEENAQ